MVSRRVNALAHQVTLLTEPDENRCFAMDGSKLEATDICHHELLVLARVCTNEKKSKRLYSA